MGKGGFSGRRMELEEQFFLKRDMELLQALREKSAAKQMKAALAEASGIGDEQLLERLIELELSGETVAALSLVPLIFVAWADGTLDDKERVAVLAAAEQQGLEKEGPCCKMLDRWLEKKPEARVIGVEPTIGHRIQGLKNMKEAIQPQIFDEGQLDDKITILDDEAFETTRMLAVREGIFVGMSAGAAVAGAHKLAQGMESGTIVAVLPDRGDRYLSTSLFKPICAKCPP